MFFIDVGLAIVVAIALSGVLLKFSNQQGPWQRRWAFGSLIFLCAWAGGAWLAPIHTDSWVTYWLPFAAVGTIAALLVAVASPTHELATDEDRAEFEREQTAVLMSVTISLYTLVGGLLVLVLAAYVI